MTDKLSALLKCIPESRYRIELIAEILAMECEMRRLEREVTRLELKAGEITELKLV